MQLQERSTMLEKTVCAMISSGQLTPLVERIEECPVRNASNQIRVAVLEVHKDQHNGTQYSDT